ncbi:tripartite tricarboxylate transporter substrate binding protein [Pigmentiphaga soli]|uniref:Tripartite tricarboxylate transporter substrate binding protein n=1 Tax=Pigmentiphaga soli TaxID=1007095 RepID=A0ABP8HLK7_9BURK
MANDFSVTRHAALLLAACVAAAPAAQAAGYPDKPVRMVVGFAPGGGSDLVARLIAQRLTDSLGQSFVVENKAGAGAMLGAEYAAKAPADGYTLLMGTSAEMTISPPLYNRMPYKPATDFEPIALLGVSPAILVANMKYPGKDLRDVVADAKKNPGQLIIASGGAGTAPHLAAEQLKILAGIDFTIAQYKGAGPSQTDTIAGHVPLVFSTIASALPLIQSQRLKPLTVIQPRRSTLLPNVPSTTDQGFKDYAAVTWFGLFAPAHTPQDVLDKLRGAVNQALADQALRSKFETMGVEVASADEGGEALRKRVSSELANWTKVIKSAGITAE